MLINCDISGVFTIIGAIASVVAVGVAIWIALRIPDKDVLSHRQRIRSIIKELHQQMRAGKRNYMIRIIDIDKFDKYYPEVFEDHAIRSYQKGELAGTDIKGVQIVDGLIGVVPNTKNKGGYLMTKGDANFVAERVGLIPYSWIVDIDLDGDEIEPSAILYCKYRKRYPLSLRSYYLHPDGSDKLIWKKGLVSRRSPYQTYSYYLIENRDISSGDTKKINPGIKVTVKGDNPLYYILKGLLF